MKRTIQKRSYLLLEVLGALLLLSICLAPLVNASFRLYKIKQQEIVQLKRALFEKQALLKIKEDLLMRKWPFSDLRKGCSHTFSLNDVQCKAYLHKQSSTDKPSIKRVGLLLKVDFTCEGMEPFSRLLFIEGVVP